MTDILLHVYGQNHEHDDVHIVGNRVALLNLVDAIKAALYTSVSKELDITTSKGHAELKEAMTADGEGYDIHVICNDSEWQGDYWKNLGLPYCSPISQDVRTEAIWPWDNRKVKLFPCSVCKDIGAITEGGLCTNCITSQGG